MKRTLLFLVALCSFPLSTMAYTVNKLPPVWVVEPFSDYKVQSFPHRLRTYPFQRNEAKKIYKIAEENGNRFLHAYDDKNISVQVMRQFHWDLKRFPWASWQWRPRILPEGADERPGIGGGNDSACGVYIIFGKYTGKALKYVWSSNAPRGTVFRKKPGKFHIIVKETGMPKNPKQWRRVLIHVADEYRKHFGADLKQNPTGFGILTDGNAVKKTSSCDYDNFTVAEHKPT